VQTMLPPVPPISREAGSLTVPKYQEPNIIGDKTKQCLKFCYQGPFVALANIPLTIDCSVKKRKFCHQ